MAGGIARAIAPIAGVKTRASGTMMGVTETLTGATNGVRILTDRTRATAHARRAHDALLHHTTNTAATRTRMTPVVYRPGHRLVGKITAAAQEDRRQDMACPHLAMEARLVLMVAMGLARPVADGGGDLRWRHKGTVLSLKRKFQIGLTDEGPVY